MSKIIDFDAERQERVESKRRDFERILFQNFLGSYSVIDSAGSIYPIQLVDISKTGCLFQVPWNINNGKKFDQGTDVSLRMYFTQTSYIPAFAEIKYGKEYIDEKGDTYMQYGCEFDTTVNSWEALASFIDFLYKFADLSVEDKGKSNKVYFL